jgi:quinol monooxygenase YgiN/3-phenylpropionate/cinnamic acid dioxygenase small subunit
MTSTDPHSLSELVDEKAIVDLTIRYTWALDHRRFDELSEVFADDGTADYGRLGIFKGPSDIAAAASRSLGRFDRTQHLVSNHQVNVDVDRANGRCYFQAQHVWVDSAGAHNYTVAGSYLDRFVRTGRGWRISERVLRVTWTGGQAPPSALSEPAAGPTTAFVIAGWIDVDAAARSELLEAAVSMMAETAKEPGNLDYNFSADPVEAGRVRVFERWRSDADLRGHFDTAHMAVFAKALAKAGVRGRELSRYHVSGTGPVFEVRN